MNSRYMCAFHLEKIKASESTALSCWLEVMRRGVQAYAQCRVEAAELYLGSALDIALVRAECEKNGMFEALHLIKPAEFLVELMISESRFNDAIQLLSRLSSLSNRSSSINDSFANCTLVDEFLANFYQRIEVTEKSYLQRDDVPTAKKATAPAQHSQQSLALFSRFSRAGAFSQDETNKNSYLH